MLMMQKACYNNLAEYNISISVTCHLYSVTSTAHNISIIPHTSNYIIINDWFLFCAQTICLV